MPYFKEQFTNATSRSEIYLNGVLQKSALGATDSVETTSFRSRRHKLAVSSQEVAASTADPYAYFLESTSGKKYRDRLDERGLQAKGDPDRGHAFELVRHTQVTAPSDVSIANKPLGTNAYSFKRGYVYPAFAENSDVQAIHGGNVVAAAPYKETGLDAFAQQAYSRVAPTSVVFDAGQFLGELHEGLPKISVSAIKNGLDFFRKAGGGYLNVEFGWKPFIDGVQDAARALLSATNELAQQGQRVHRKYSLPSATSYASQSNTSTLYAALGVYRGAASNDNTLNSGSQWATSLNCDASYDYAKARHSTRWFEGEFSSFLPLRFDPSSFIERANVLISTKMSPSVLWELAPWSWLVDWNLRVGDTIRANEMNANNLLIMHYGYAMEETVYSTTLSWTRLSSPPAASYIHSGIPQKGYSVGRTVYKRRLRANPYGFRLGGAGALTGNQYSILGALGLTKLK